MRIGIDFGGTKIEAIGLDAEGAVLARKRVLNPGAYDDAIGAVADLVAFIEGETGRTGSIGMGTPGSQSPRTGLMRNSNSVYLNGRTFGADLEARLGRPVRLANDANCLALSEATDGAAAGAKAAFAIIIGTGCGGGLVVDGKLVEGVGGVAAEIGHIGLPWATAEEAPGPECWCGLRGCLEEWVSGSGLQRDHRARTGQALDAPAIVAAARAGEAASVESLDRYVDRLGRAIAMITNMVDPDVVVLGGGMSNVGELYERLPAVVERHAFSDSWEGRIVPAVWGDASGVRGAARLWPLDEVQGDPS
ncbi:ROK family protein [Brevundimonas staleyi]|uniref:ROK family protein n=1 Tax=Brevundimonas staleyi TaxID=74326 RepID=A0ABW0FW40_9CAUL